MKGSQKVIDMLNARLAEEFGAVHQYTAHESYAKVNGYAEYAGYVGKRKADELEHIREVSERIIFLGGVPAVDKAAGVSADISGLPEGLVRDDVSEETAILGYRELAQVAMCENDFGTFTLATHILAEEEEHKRAIEANLAQFEQMGSDNWLSLQV